MLESIAELRGIWVTDLERGCLLGTVSGMTVDPSNGEVAGLIYRTRKGPKQKFFVPRAQIDKIGRDVVFLKSDTGQAIEHIEDAPGVSLKELQGQWVTTMDGKHLGTLVDIDFSPSDWKISELELSQDKRLGVDASAIKIGDEILVPAEYADHLKDMPQERYGAMGRILGAERIDDLRKAMEKALRRDENRSDD